MCGINPKPNRLRYESGTSNLKNTKAWKEHKDVVNSAKSGIIKSLDVEDFNLMASTTEILPEVYGVISDTLKEYERKGGMHIFDVHFGDFFDEETGAPALFQIFPNALGMTEMNINSRILGGSTIDEVDRRIAKTLINLPQNLQEAIVHECGHAKAYYGKTVNRLQK